VGAEADPDGLVGARKMIFSLEMAGFGEF